MRRQSKAAAAAGEGGMAAKLEVLKRALGGAQTVLPPASGANASMSLSFKIPAQFLQSRVQQTAASAKPAPAATLVLEPEDDDEEKQEGTDVVASWEDQDWDLPVENAASLSAVASESKAAKAAAQWAAQTENEADPWNDELTTPDLPDDFPVLIINLTRVQREHVDPDAPPLEPEQVSEFYSTVKKTLHRHFTQMVEVLFEQKSCFHCTYGTVRGMLGSLEAAHPEELFAIVDYPVEIDGTELHEFLHELSRPSRWKSVDYIKDCLRRCSRDLKWKREVAVELELLAEQEHDRHQKAQDHLGAEIDDLTRLRDSFREKLAKTTTKEGKANSQYLMLRKLEDIEQRLLMMLDTYLQDNELTEDECCSIFDLTHADGPSAGMNVLDMVVAMIFGRLPIDLTKQSTTEEHFEMLLDHHIHIRRLWKKDFGRLPLKSKAAQATQHREHVGSDADQPNVMHEETEDEDDEEPALQEDFATYCEIEESDEWANATPLAGDDWETIETEEARGSIEQEDEDDKKSVCSEGYGADYESEESEDEGEDKPRAPPQPSTNTRSSKKETDSKADGRFETPVVLHPRAAARENRRRSRSKAKKKKSCESKEMAPKEAALFQPFACTGALGLLRLAKENEMF